MSLKAFNVALLAGWLLASAGGILLNVGAGLLLSGVLLVGLTLFCVRYFGIYQQDGEKNAE